MAPSINPSSPSIPGIPRTVKLVAASQVWGGSSGAWVTAQALISSPNGGALRGVLLAGALLYYSLLGGSAVFVLRGRRRALRFLAWAQLPQLIVLQTAHFKYSSFQASICYSSWEHGLASRWAS